jgi:large subunit ribosomal protein L3
MSATLLGQKVGMTQVYDEKGVLRPVTVISLGPCHVLQVKTKDKDGYDAVQLGFADKKRTRAIKSERGHAAKAKVEPKKFVREVRLKEPATLEPGAELKVDLFAQTPRVDVIGLMKGRGFAGVMKRHGFSGLEKTHGVLRKHRSGGSIGANTSPGRVRKGVKMAGHYGHSRTTVRNLRVVKIDPENNTMLVCGSVPGPDGAYVTVRATNKLRQKKERDESADGKKKKK